jgi:hypothetical protein
MTLYRDQIYLKRGMNSLLSPEFIASFSLPCTKTSPEKASGIQPEIYHLLPLKRASLTNLRLKFHHFWGE